MRKACGLLASALFAGTLIAGVATPAANGTALVNGEAIGHFSSHAECEGRRAERAEMRLDAWSGPCKWAGDHWYYWGKPLAP